MNAHRPAKSRLTKKEKAAVDEYFNSVGNDYLRRVFKIFCIVLNSEYGFGTSRLSNVIQKVSVMVCSKDPIFWYHADREMERLGLPFDKERDL